MKTMQCLLGVVMCVNIFLEVQAASLDLPDVPNFPTRDDYRVIVGSNLNPPARDITDDEPSAAPAPVEITHMRVRSEIALRYARTAIICNVYNPSKRAQQAAFNVLLPETAFISGFTMSLGKETYEAYVKEKEEAKQIYDDAVSQEVSAAHVATKARDSNHFSIKFNVEARSNATYHLRYEEFLARRNGVYNHAINLHPGALVPKMDVVVHIKESQRISVLRVPELRTGNEVDATEKDAQNTNAVIKRGRNEREATVTFTPSLAEQKELAEVYAEKTKQSNDPDSLNIGYDSEEESVENEGLLGQFVVQYDVDQPINGEILVNDGYFVHLFAPRSLPPLRKHAVFVLDTSGSMYGTKITQLRGAMRAILDDLRPTDRFHIVEFNSHVQVHSVLKEVQANNQELVPAAIASPENKDAAKDIISNLQANGGTDIYKALDVALNLIQANQTEPKNDAGVVDFSNGTETKTCELEPIIIFLTDGDPTVGETNIERILKHVSEKNSGEKRAPLFSLAFGDDADRVFLRKLSLRNEGFMRHIYEAADAALQLHDFYRQVSSPLLANVRFLYPRRQIKEGSVSRSQFRSINDGSEVAVVGKIAENVDEITPQVRGSGGDGNGRRKLYEINTKAAVTSKKDDYLPLERLWAYLTIKQLLDKRDAGDDGLDDDTSANESPEQKALAIALKYSFVTPLTSLVVVRLNKTDVEDAVNAETVDEPNFLPYKRSPSPPVTKTYYTGFSSGSGLSVASSNGPVLFIQSSRRLNLDTFGHSAGNKIFGGNGSSAGSFGGSSGSGVPPRGVGGVFKEIAAVTYPPTPRSVLPAAATRPPMHLDPAVEAYHLEGYEWALSYVNSSTHALVLPSGQLLKLAKHDDSTPGGDYECRAQVPGKDDAWRKTATCVYLTRCRAARRPYTAQDYLDNYCYVGDGYAGVCCPRSEIDSKP